MDLEYPSLEVCHPEGKEDTVWLGKFFRQARDKNSITIGRLSDNDIVLFDPYLKVSRYHCAIKRGIDRRWWLVDENSANGTFLQQGKGTHNIDVRSDGRLPLEDGNIILILCNLLDQNKPVFWQLTFRDYMQTEQVEEFQPPANVEYSLSQQKLFRVTHRNRKEIYLSEKELALIHYMALQNHTENNQPKVCEYNEQLIKAIWGGDSNSVNRNKCEVDRLVFGVRKKIEPDSKSPSFLKTVRNQGYLLNIRILS